MYAGPTDFLLTQLVGPSLPAWCMSIESDSAMSQMHVAVYLSNP